MPAVKEIAMHDDLPRTGANFVALSPIDFLARTAALYPDRPAIRYGALERNYAELHRRCRRLAAALAARGIGRGDVVSILAPNTPAHLEAHFGIPMAGAAIHSINTRLDASAIAFMLGHGGSRLLLVDEEFVPLARHALALLDEPVPFILLEDDAAESDADAQRYEAFLTTGDEDFESVEPADEWDPIALNYTSGTTGDPKGVVYHHRGAYLNAVGNVLAWELGRFPVYLWTLPMFHCNGWCFPWTITALAGTHVCLRRADAEPVIAEIVRHGVTHLAGAPIILSRIVNAEPTLRAAVPSGLRMMVAGAPPAAAVIAAAEEIGLAITQTYGLTEVYGPCVVCEWKPEWDSFPADERARLKARQGVRYQLQKNVDVRDPVTLSPTPADGETMGEIMITGNVVMKGYLKDGPATDRAFEGGWFHTGDIAVKHPDGYIEIRDRSKDIIISGGENISTVEIEGVLMAHPAVLEAAVVARPDELWGETPCAFVALKPAMQAGAQDLIAFCDGRLARFKIPKTVIFGDIPKTSTGKTQKFILRERARTVGEAIPAEPA
jgi:fatty-acyl-CoA synthase